MKYSIKNKLIASGIIMLSLIILMVAGSQIIVGFFKNTTEELIIEYHELHAIQELKISLSNLSVFVNGIDTQDLGNSETEFRELIYKSNNKLKICKEVISLSHDTDLLYDFELIIDKIDRSVNELYQISEKEPEQIIKFILIEVNTGIQKVDLLVKETKDEIEEYEERNNTVILHGTFTVVSFGLILILLLAFGGWRFIRSLINPINELVSVTERISKGDRKVKVNVSSNDEFLTLANSFNNMVAALDETMVSKNYLNNILENMFDPLMVTDKNGIIISVNSPSLELFGYEKNEFVDRHIMMFFDKPISKDVKITLKLKDYQQFINNQKYFISKNGKPIPVLLSCSFLKNQKNELAGLIVVGHDLTERHAYEEKLEQNRKEQHIAINEAQEEERLRIASDLHDGLGQMLSAISFSIQDLNQDDSRSNDSILKIQNQIDSAIREAKNISHNLIPIVLKDFGLVVAIDNMVAKANELHETKFRVKSYDFNDRIDPKLEKALYRICQESLTNIVKHAKAKIANFQLFRAQGYVVLVIDDDGQGYDMHSYESGLMKKGIGLISIRERVEAFDGTFSIDSQKGKGTELIIEIPCRKNDGYGKN